ncbi:MAG: phosphatase PAP2 family protein [Ignavibacteriales bacterium]|nr:phosphatase PAP2 family protein [Ignavibacteriales bacterium]
MTSKILSIGRIQLRATDGLILATLAFFTVLSVLFMVEGWVMLVLKNVAVAAAYVVFNAFSERVQHKFWRFFVRVAAVTLTYAYLFGAVDKLQLIIHDRWLDEYVTDFEQYIFGVQPTLWLQEYTTPALTEWMMFSYVIYVPMYPVLCGIIYYLHGELAMEDYFFTLGFTNILCDIGFILFPVAGPLPYIGHLYTVPLDGYVWTYLGELMRSQLHYIGGTIPSPHCAAATIMWIMAYRYYRPAFYVLIPIVLSLYVSTFYGRYHYVTDAVLGVAVAFVALTFVPIMVKLWERIGSGIPVPVNVEKPTRGAT